MSDKTSDKYRITLTENQLALVGTAVEIMLRSGMGQTYDLAEWLTLKGNDYPHGNGFDIYIAERNLIASVLEGIMRTKTAHNKEESEPLRELKTLYEAIRHQRWKDSRAPEWDVRSHKPMMCGKEPVPKIVTRLTKRLDTLNSRIWNDEQEYKEIYRALTGAREEEKECSRKTM